MYNKIIEAKEKLISYLQQFAYLRNAFISLCILYFLSFIALIRANVYYMDDIARAERGIQGWDDFARYLSNCLSTVVHTNHYLADVSPLTQLLAIILLAMASTIILYIFTHHHHASVGKTGLIKILAVMPVGISPYFLQCMSFKYDSPYMALSILFMVFPFIFYKPVFHMRSAIIYTLTSLICILGMCTTYQASSGIYPIIVIFLSLKMWNDNDTIKDILKFILISALAYGVSMFIFRFFIIDPSSGYRSISMLPLNRLIPGCISNIKEYYKLVVSDYRRTWIYLIMLILLCFICLTVFNSARNKLLSAAVTLLALLCVSTSSFGIYIFLQSPSYDPRAMYGIGIALAIIMVQCCSSDKIGFAKILCALTTWCFIVFSFIYSNALAEQQRYIDYRIQLVISDLNELEIMTTDTSKTLQLTGTAGKSPIIRNMPDGYDLLNKLIPTSFGGTGWSWDERYFRRYFDLRNIEQNTDINLTEYDLPILKDTMFHTIRGNDQYILIEIK